MPRLVTNGDEVVNEGHRPRRRRRIVACRQAGCGAVESFDELRTGFTAAVSHELRTPLARILALLDSADLPGADVRGLIEQARAEVENAGTLIDEILFLSELESGQARSSRSGTRTRCRCSSEVLDERGAAAARAGVGLEAAGDAGIDLPLRPRMLRIVAENLVENAIRYAGHGATFRLAVARQDGSTSLTASRRRRRRRRGRPGPAVRALLARRHRARVARHRARPRDRQARRGGRRRHRRGARRARPRPRGALRVPARLDDLEGRAVEQEAAPDRELASVDAERRLVDRPLVGSPVPRDADADRGSVRGVERVHERVVVPIRVEGVDPAPVGARRTRDGVAVHVSSRAGACRRSRGRAASRSAGRRRARGTGRGPRCETCWIR